MKIRWKRENSTKHGGARHHNTHHFYRRRHGGSQIVFQPCDNKQRGRRHNICNCGIHRIRIRTTKLRWGMGGGELHLESSRQPGHSKESLWCCHSSKRHHLSELKSYMCMIYSHIVWRVKHAPNRTEYACFNSRRPGIPSLLFKIYNLKKKKLFEEEKIAFNVLSFCICPTHSIITLSNNLLKSINKKNNVLWKIYLNTTICATICEMLIQLCHASHPIAMNTCIHKCLVAHPDIVWVGIVDIVV